MVKGHLCWLYQMAAQEVAKKGARIAKHPMIQECHPGAWFSDDPTNGQPLGQMMIALSWVNHNVKWPWSCFFQNTVAFRIPFTGTSVACRMVPQVHPGKKLEVNSPNHQLVPRNSPGLDRTSWLSDKHHTHFIPFHGEPSRPGEKDTCLGSFIFPHVE